MASGTRIRVLKAAVRATGGARKLRDRLGVRSAAVAAWLAGTEELPEPVFLRALELVLDDMDRHSS